MLDFVLDEFINYLATAKNYSPRTLPQYRSYLCRFFEQQHVKLPSDITPEKAERYMGWRVQNGRNPNSNSTFMNALRAFLIFGNKRGYTNTQIDMYEVPRRKRVRTEFVTPEEVNKMVSVTTRERDRLIILVLFTSSCRVSELVQITVENLRDNSFTVMVKGGKEHTYFFDETVATRLQNYLAIEGIQEGHVFRNTTGRAIQTPAISHIVRKAARLANISHNVHPHMFRHGYGAYYMEQGGDMRSLQEQMGHESILTTQRYAHLSDKVRRQRVAQFAPKVTPVYNPIAVDKSYHKQF